MKTEKVVQILCKESKVRKSNICKYIFLYVLKVVNYEFGLVSKAIFGTNIIVGLVVV